MKVEEHRSNVDGKATAITVMSPVWPFFDRYLEGLFWVARQPAAGPAIGALGKLSFIHYARWTLIRKFPKGKDGERLRHSYLFFESNFNGTWEEYIDAFSETIPLRMWLIWFSSFGFPGPKPVGPFKDYIRKNEYIANHYWNAYPGAAATEVVSAGEVAAALEPLIGKAAELDDETFAAAYRDMLSKAQPNL